MVCLNLFIGKLFLRMRLLSLRALLTVTDLVSRIRVS
jgi:hypothetical protein